MYTDTRSASYDFCYANVAGFSDFETVVFIVIKYKNGQSSDASELIERYYLRISSLVNNLTNQLIEELKSIEDKLNK